MWERLNLLRLPIESADKAGVYITIIIEPIEAASCRDYQIGVACLPMYPVVLVTQTGACGALPVSLGKFGMVFKFIRSIREGVGAIQEGRDDAKAAMAEPKFLATMDLVETLSPVAQDVIAELVERALVKDIRERYAKYLHLPEQSRQGIEYLRTADSKNLRLLAEHFFSEGRRVKVGIDSSPNGPGVAVFELLGYYLLAQSWQDLEHTANIDAPGLGARMIGLRIEMRIHAFLGKQKQGRSLRRSC